MKILYISPENTVGTLTLWKKEHERRGNHCRTLTFFKSPKSFNDDICLNLPFNFTNPKMANLRNEIYKLYRGEEGYFKEKKGYPPVWKPEGFFDNVFLKIKDIIWKPIIYKAIKKFELDKFDVYHFESGMDFLKNESFVKQLIRKNKKIICHYHGEDLRSRGVMPLIDKVSDLNLTNELDLLDKHPNLKYLFLPFETSRFTKKTSLNKILRVGHAPTNRFYKGSDHIIKVCQKLKLERKIEFDLIENVTNRVALKRKSKLDIFIDQVGDRGGWGKENMVTQESMERVMAMAREAVRVIRMAMVIKTTILIQLLQVTKAISNPRTQPSSTHHLRAALPVSPMHMAVDPLFKTA